MNAASPFARWGPYSPTRRPDEVRPRRVKRLLVPLDGSRLAERVIPFVLRLAGAFDLDVLLVRVVSATPPTVVDGTHDVRMYDVPERLTEARRYLAEIAAKLRERGVRVKTRARYGTPAVQIVAVARELAADLIAMTTRTGDEVGWPVVDSIAAAVLCEAEIPVLMMGAARREAQAASPPDLDVILLNVNGFVPPMTIQSLRPFGADDFVARREEAGRYLNLVATELRMAGVRVHTRVRGGKPVDEILGAARDEAVDLIAMATHDRSGPARWLWGSVAESVIRQAPVPVFLLRRPEKGISGRRRDRALHVTRSRSAR